LYLFDQGKFYFYQGKVGEFLKVMHVATMHKSTLTGLGSQAFLATLLFDPSMSGFSIIAKQNFQILSIHPSSNSVNSLFYQVPTSLAFISNLFSV